ncbi:MAG: DUF481 domain-containing protein [Ghiorsea sp.]|nr:DUF481 domain-containing protein [Ghiorsea sp.]
MKKILMAVLLSAVFAGQAAAEGWTGNAELGYVQTGGNAETSSLNLKGKAVNDGDEWRTALNAGALNSDSAGTTTSEKYDFSAQIDWKMSESGYLFARYGYEQDKFGGYNSRMSETVGYGFDIMKTDDKQWNAEVGVGARQSEDTTGATTDDTIVRASTVFNWQINKSSKFTQELSTEGGDAGYTTKSLTALTNQLAGNLSSKISYAVQNNSKAPTGTKASDTILSASLVFSY